MIPVCSLLSINIVSNDLCLEGDVLVEYFLQQPEITKCYVFPVVNTCVKCGIGSLVFMPSIYLQIV